ncbi:hypothetical protein RHGRI_025130 [Rhododendron griersonianum]|uniref:DNA-directed RNA polymerase I subunit rpa49 n=1 Tax=Rhododendron griersonianum TaxID=479676 RepID=A0AAV6JDL6_9ERIC|nr:hypothetical protein RHGRI_025130 [Rhododendron griersonianum]
MQKAQLLATMAEMSEEKSETLVEEEQNNTKKHKKAKEKIKEEEIQVKIETLGENPNKVSPFVGYFPSGFDPLKNQATAAGEPPQATVRIFRHEKRTNRLQLVVSPNNGFQVDFVGTNYSGEATAPQLCTYALGVLDKQLQTLKIVPIASNKIFRLEPRVGGLDLSVKEPSKEEELTTLKKFEKREALDDIYGTKKAINRNKKRKSLSRKDDPEAQENLDRKFEGVKINKEALESAGMHSSRNTPPHDSSATTPQMAYPLDKIILKGEWDYLVDILELFQHGAEIAPDGYPSFICNRLHRLESIEDEVEKKRLACVFSYINHLVKFKDKYSMEGCSSAKHHKIPSILSQKFSTMFGYSDKKRLEDEKRDLLISYVLVLTLIADDFRTAVPDITKDLRLDSVTVKSHFENLGCKLMIKNKVLLATLPVPLMFPKAKYKHKPKR